MKKSLFAGLACLTFFNIWASAAEWRPAGDKIKTQWAGDVNPASPLPEYPRPQLARERWVNLNGLWRFAVTAKDSGEPEKYPAQILVPFAPESSLSGLARQIEGHEKVWYTREFATPAMRQGERLLLHFDASNWETTVWVNGKLAGEHRGGYGRFSFDITESLNPSGANRVSVSVWNPVEDGLQTQGKQKRDAIKHPGGYYYTPATGLWQTVWLEPVADSHVREIRLVPNAGGTLTVSAKARTGQGTWRLGVEIWDGNTLAGSGVWDADSQGGEARFSPAVIEIKNPKWWSAENPFLYDVKITLRQGERVTDSVKSYCGLRTVSVVRDAQGLNRVLLNGSEIFMAGPLDQGYWPDGIYTAPTDEALKSDLVMTLKYGFNTNRKHVKVEPDRWYYWADRLGVLVWQDMPTSWIGKEDKPKDAAAAAQFERELGEMIEQHFNAPSIVMWVIFNEGNGQFDTARLTELVKASDPSRLVNSASGWVDRGTGDFVDVHPYPGPGIPPRQEQRAAGLGEFGGLAFSEAGHTWTDAAWGYRSYPDKQALWLRFVELWRKTWRLKEQGLCAAIYTQLTDVETEGNGLMTYDRKVCKIAPEKTALLLRGIFPPEPKRTPLLPASASAEGAVWRYTTGKPAEGWQKFDFDDTGWREGRAGFGAGHIPNNSARTEWKSDEIWLRRKFVIPPGVNPNRLLLTIYHDDDAQVFLNGVPAATLNGFLTDYEDVDLRPEALAALKAGENVIAIRCVQKGGGQFIDAGLTVVEPVE